MRAAWRTQGHRGLNASSRSDAFLNTAGRHDAIYTQCVLDSSPWPNSAVALFSWEEFCYGSEGNRFGVISGHLVSVRRDSGARRSFGARGILGVGTVWVMSAYTVIVNESQLPRNRVLGFCPGIVSTVKVCVVFLDTFTPEFELYVRLRERRQGTATRICGCAVACSALVVGGQTPVDVLVPNWSYFQCLTLGFSAGVPKSVRLGPAGVVLVVSTVLVLLRNYPTEPVTCEAHPFFFQVKESRRVHVPLLVPVGIIVDSGPHHQQSNIGGGHEYFKVNIPTVVKWLHPPSGILKLNVDGAFKLAAGGAGGGGILRDHKGICVFTFTKNYQGIISTLAAEALALCDGLTICCSKGFMDIVVETDSLNLVQIVTGQIPRL
ncbi:hypothetical protein Taro_028055 [Colocasia esculenta]|uniref:RNase H type-1 domain-containing protein n=1 Tax=Colocasia esculenta TaxID=4460 RepID=A0A843VT36_COLES|nr:hypothetical protein [Colocasia esculenta]